MKNLFLTLIAAILGSFLFVVPVFALTMNTIGDTTYFSDGTTANTIGGTTYFSDGSTINTIGGTTYFGGNGRSGTANTIGGTTYFSDGTTANRIGGTTYFSDGSTMNTIAGTTYINPSYTVPSIPRYIPTMRIPVAPIIPTVTPSFSCSSYGSGSYLGVGNKCYCSEGFEWNLGMTQCVIKTSCLDGYVKKAPLKCRTYTQDCQDTFGNLVYGSKGLIDNTSSCYCNTGYQWNSIKTACVPLVVNHAILNPGNLSNQDLNQATKLLSKRDILERELSVIGKANSKIYNKYKGKILIEKIDDQDVYWYVSTQSRQRYLLASASDLLDTVQKTAMFVNSKKLALIQKYPQSALGRFIANTESSGHFYVNPIDKKIYDVAPKGSFQYDYEHYEQGLETLKRLGVRISNTDIAGISIGTNL